MKIKISWLVVLCLVLAMISGLFTACTDSAEEDIAVEEEEEEVVELFPVTITDQEDREVKVDKAPEKIISLTPSSTEILFALGLDDNIVAVTQYCNYPAEALDKAKIGGFSETDIDVSIEQIVAIEPDLIVATETHLTQVVPQLEQFAPDATIVVLLTQTESFDVVFDAINLLGQCTGTEDKAVQLVDNMKNRIKAITDKTDNLLGSEKPGVLYIVWHEPIFAIGGGTLGNTLIEAAGGVNIFQELTGAPIIDLETIIIRNPDIIFGSAAVGAGADLPYQFALSEERLDTVNARINNQVYGVNDDLTGRPGPRIVEGLELLAGYIHPEIFE